MSVICPKCMQDTESTFRLIECRAELGALKADAERYRWLRSCSALDPQRHQPPSDHDWWANLGDSLDEDFDESIDAAMQPTTPEEK